MNSPRMMDHTIENPYHLHRLPISEVVDTEHEQVWKSPTKLIVTVRFIIQYVCFLFGGYSSNMFKMKATVFFMQRPDTLWDFGAEDSSAQMKRVPTLGEAEVPCGFPPNFCRHLNGIASWKKMEVKSWFLLSDYQKTMVKHTWWHLKSLK